jgi:hypothetical protein
LVYDPSADHHVKRSAEAELRALSRTEPALDWALHALRQPASADLQALFFAATAVDEAVAYRWTRLEPARQAALRECLWRCATDPARPHFVRAKLAQSLAHVLCLEWPSGWPELHACVADPARAEAGVGLLSATLDHFRSLAQNTSYGVKGKVGCRRKA